MELTIVDARNNGSAIAVARMGTSMAIEPLATGNLAQLSQMKDEINQVILGKALRLNVARITTIGNTLFSFVMPGKIMQMFRRLPKNTSISVQISSDHEVIRGLPWEFMQDPDLTAGPKGHRSLVRVVPTIDFEFEPIALAKRALQVLFIWSQPDQLAATDWESQQRSLERAFGSRMPDRYKIKVIEAASPAALVSELRQNSYDILHFCGHGRVVAGVSELLFQTLDGSGVVPVNASDFSNLVSGFGLQLIILGACNSSSGSFEQFSVVAETLVQSGVPCVVANQFAIKTSSLSVFTSIMYDELLRNRNIDSAVAQARLGVYMDLQSKKTAALDWGVPTVYRHAGAAELFLA